jgi:hypothetical protein
VGAKWAAKCAGPAWRRVRAGAAARTTASGEIGTQSRRRAAPRGRFTDLTTCHSIEGGDTEREDVIMRASLRISVVATLVTALVAAAAGPALAQGPSPRDVLRDFGLLGTWATDCDQPASETNFYAVYAGTPDGNVRRTYYNTADREKAYNVYVITRAIRLPADQLSYKQKGPGDEDKIDVILMKDGNRYKIWSSVRDNGEVLVEKGKFPKSGEDSPWQAKCHD